MNLPPAAVANRNAVLFDRTGTIGIGIHGTVGGISALVTLLLLFHLFMVAAVRRGKVGKVNGEKVFMLTRLGAYFACLLVSDLLISFGQFIQVLWATLGGITEGPLCTTQAVMIQIGGYGTAVFSSVIAIHSFSVIVLQKTSSKSVAIWVITLGWAIPIGVDLFAIIFHRAHVPIYGLAQHWCWIRPEYPTLRVLLHYLPILLSAFISVICYSLLFLTVRGNLHIDGGRVTLRRGWQGQMESNDDYRDMLSVLANRMLWYPISYIVLIMPMTVVQLLFITNHTIPFAAWVIGGIALASLGFSNVVIYCITRVVLGRPPTPTAWDTGSQSTLVIRSPNSVVKEECSEYLPTPNKINSNGSALNYPEYGGQASVVPLNMQQPPPTSHPPHPAVPHPVVHALPRNSPPRQILSHLRGDSEATMAERRAYGLPSHNNSYSSKRSGSMAAPAPSTRAFFPERITTPELLQRPITPSSVLAMEMENPRSTSLGQHRRNIPRLTNDDGLSSLAPPPRPVASHSPSTSIGSRLERSRKSTGRGEYVEDQQTGSWKGPSRGVALSAVKTHQSSLPPN